MNNRAKEQAEGITWISPQSLIRLRANASQLPLDRGKIHAKQGGAYLSSFKGRGMEFDESRIYQPGDDIRNMDWRVTARTNTPHTKVFCEERERPVLIWLDLNPSMFFATRGSFKSVVASKISALLAWSTCNNNDRLGGLIFSAEKHVECRPRRGKSAALDFIGQSCKHPAWQSNDRSNGQQQAYAQEQNHATDSDYTRTRAKRDMSASVIRLRKVTHPGSLIFMVSDFREMNDSAYSNLANIARHNDIVLVHIYDPIETDLPLSGNYKVTDGNTTVQIDAGSRKVRQQYHQRFEQRLNKIQQFCRKNRIFMLSISTAGDSLQQLQQGLGIRTARQTKKTPAVFSGSGSHQ